MSKPLQTPISDDAVTNLRVGDVVSLSGVIVTGRDAAHKYMVEQLIGGEVAPEERDTYAALQETLAGGVIYHCGPIVSQTDGRWRFVSAGPTTSIREEPYQDKVIEHFGIKAVIGKGGMGPRTLAACQAHKAVYLHAVGGAASVIAETVEEVLDVYKLELGQPEAFWKIKVKDFSAVVTMDAHGNSLHKDVAGRSREILESIW